MEKQFICLSLQDIADRDGLNVEISVTDKVVKKKELKSPKSRMLKRLNFTIPPNNSQINISYQRRQSVLLLLPPHHCLQCLTQCLPQTHDD